MAIQHQLARRRAVGIIRVSHVGDRKGDSFISPTEQRQQIERVCDTQGWDLTEVFEELDVSGGAPLAKRRGLKPALTLIETRQADVLVVAYFDRLWRDLVIQLEVVQRVEDARGMVYAADVGEISTRTASRWLSSTMLGLVAEFHRRITSEKVAAARIDAVERGVVPWAQIIPGYRRERPGGVLVVEPSEAPHVAEAFRLRAQGASLQTIRTYLQSHGIKRSYAATKSLLRSRLPLGEVVFGEMANVTAHEPIVDRVTWQRAQNTRVPRGRRPTSTRLLARLNLLRCGTCQAAMAAATVKSHGKPYPVYRCGMSADCSRGAAISCDILERAVTRRVTQVLQEESESASPETNIAEAEADLAHKEADLDAAVAAFDGLNVASARQRLLDMQAGVESARQRLERLRATATPAQIVNANRDWRLFTLDEQRALVRATIARVTVWPGRGAERFRIETLSE